MHKIIIFIIGLILSTFLSYKIYRDYAEANVQLNIIDNQILNIDNIHTLYSINVSMKEYRGLLQLDNTHSNSLHISERSLISKEIDRLLHNIDDLKLKGKILNILQTSYPDKEESFFEYTQIINILNFKIISISSQNKFFSQIHHENSDQVYSIVRYIPQMIENIAKIRGLGSYIITNKKITNQQKYIIKEQLNNFNIYFKKINNHPKTIDDLYSHFKDLTLTLENIFNNNFNVDVASYFKKSSVIIDILGESYLTIEKDIKSSLELDKKKINKQISFILSELVLGLLLIILFAIYIYKKIDAIQQKKQKLNDGVKISNELYDSLSSVDSVKEKCQISIKFLLKKTAYTYGVMYLVDNKNGQLTLAATYNIEQYEIEHVISLQDKEFIDIIHAKEKYIIQKQKKVIFSSFDAYFEKIVSMPILNDDNTVIAIVQLYCVKDKELISSMGDMLSIIGNNVFKAQKNEENEKYFKLIDKHVITSTTNKDGIINYVSEAFCNISGYSKEELLGKSHNILRHPEIKPEVYKKIWETIKSGKTCITELTNKKKDGSTYWVKITISPELGFFGDIVGYNSIREDITDKKIIQRVSITDSMTNLYNRRHFDEIFPKHIAIAKRDNIAMEENKFLAFILLDVDHFKQYNDTYGHHSGDLALQSVATILRETFKRPDDYIFRLGGEEFGVLLFSSTREHLCEMGNQLIKNVEQKQVTHETNSASKFLTISAGVYIVNNDDVNDVNDIYQKSDKLLYKAKESGRNQARCSTM